MNKTGNVGKIKHRFLNKAENSLIKLKIVSWHPKACLFLFKQMTSHGLLSAQQGSQARSTFLLLYILSSFPLKSQWRLHKASATLDKNYTHGQIMLMPSVVCIWSALNRHNISILEGDRDFDNPIGERCFPRDGRGKFQVEE